MYRIIDRTCMAVGIRQRLFYCLGNYTLVGRASRLTGQAGRLSYQLRSFVPEERNLWESVFSLIWQGESCKILTFSVIKETARIVYRDFTYESIAFGDKLDNVELKLTDPVIVGFALCGKGLVGGTGVATVVDIKINGKNALAVEPGNDLITTWASVKE